MNAEQFQQRTGVSHETLEHYQIWYDLLSRWNRKINLVARATLHDFWLRHVLDSWQLIGLLPKDTKTVLDMGAGAGFPGLAIAIALNELGETPDAHITLVESNGKKCNFLRTVIRECALPATAVQSRIENLEAKPYDIITARAFAPLPMLLEYSLPFFAPATTALFPKGETWQSEVETAQANYSFDLKTTNSLTADNAKILTITNLTARESER